LSAGPFAIDMPCDLVTDIDGPFTLMTTPITVHPNMWRISIGEETRTAVAVVICTVLLPFRLARYFQVIHLRSSVLRSGERGSRSIQSTRRQPGDPFSDVTGENLAAART